MKHHDKIFSELTPQAWADMEEDVVTRLHALREICEGASKAPNNAEALDNMKRVVVRLLALLGEFTVSIKHDGPWIILDPPSWQKTTPVKWNKN